MHFTTKLAGICIAAALAITASASAQTFQKKSDGARPPAPNMVTQGGYSSAQQKAGGNKASAPQVLSPGKPSPRAVPQNSPTAPKGKNVPLSDADCKDLGGSVQISLLCNSGLLCSRKDQNGKSHHVCISAK